MSTSDERFLRIMVGDGPIAEDDADWIRDAFSQAVDTGGRLSAALGLSTKPRRVFLLAQRDELLRIGLASDPDFLTEYRRWTLGRGKRGEPHPQHSEAFEALAELEGEGIRVSQLGDRHARRILKAA